MLPASANYVSYFKSVNRDGDTIALVRREGEERFIIIGPVGNGIEAKGTDIVEANGHDDFKAKCGGELVKLEDGDYNQQLEDWGYDGSDRYRAGVAEEKPEPVNPDQKPADPSEGNGTMASNPNQSAASKNTAGFKDETRNSNEPGPKTEGGTLTDANHAPSTGVAPDQNGKPHVDPDANAASAATQPNEVMKGETERTSAQEATKKEKAGI